MALPSKGSVREESRNPLKIFFAFLAVAALVITPSVLKLNAAQAVDTDNWPLPANAEIVDSSIISAGISSNGPTGTDSLELVLSYRATVSPGLEWIYLRIDPDLAPYIDEMSLKASGQGANILYTRYFEKVEDNTLGNVKNNGSEYGAIDPYAGDGNVWRVHNDRKYGIAPGTNPKTRRALGGNWGVFTGVPLQNQLMFAPITVTLNTPIEQIREETGRDLFVADARWQNSPDKAGGKVEIDNESISTGATIDLSADPDEDTPGGDIFSWLYSQSFHRHEYGYEMPVMTTSKKLGDAPAESSTLRVVHVESVGNVTYATVGSTKGLGYKPYQFNIKLQPEVIEALEGPAVVWQTGIQKNTGRAGAGDPPVEIPKSAFTPEGEVTVTTDQSKAGVNGFVVVDDVSTFLNTVSGGIFQPATVVDLPLDEDKLIPNREDPNYFKQIRIKTWFTDATDRTLKYSPVNSYFNLHISDSPTITNISTGVGTSGDELTAETDVVRQTQNFIQGTANPNAEVTVMKVTGLATAAEKREVLGQATADENGNWSTKLCKPTYEYNDDGELTNTIECETKSFEDNGITTDSDAKVIVVARDYLQAASKDILVDMIDVQTNDPAVDYTAEAPLAKDATVIEGKLGPQHQNTTATVVTAYIKAPADQPTTRQANNDGLTKIGSTSPIMGNTTGGQPFSIPVTAAQLKSCPDIVLKAVESTHPKNPSATMPTAKDDAYSPSNEVVVPVCEQVTVTFDLNGGTLAEPINPVSVAKGEALGETFPAGKPVKDGFTFKGWATTADAHAGNFDATTAVTKDTTVYAAWSTQAIDWGEENGDEDGNLVTVPGTYDYGQQLTPADYKALIQNGDKLPAHATVSVSPEINTTPADAAGHNQPVDVTVTFGDGSTLTAPVDITIRPASDSFAPVAEAIDVEKGEQPSATAIENAVTDSDGKAFPDGTTIKLKEPVDTSTVGETTGTVVVTYPDGSTDEITIPINVVDSSNAATYEPTTDTITVPYGGELPALDSAVSNKAELPMGTTYEDVTNPAIDTTKPGTYKGRLKVNYPDTSTETVPVTVVVQTAAESFDPQAAPVDVNLNEHPTAEQLLAATTLDGTTPLPAGSTVAVVGTLDTSAPGEIADVPLLVTYPDGTTDSITTTVNVIDNRTDAEKFPATPVTQPVDVPYGGTFNPEDGIANTADLPGGTTYKDVTNAGAGVDTTVPGASTAQVEVTYQDGSTAVVDVPVHVLTATETFDPAASDITVEINTDPTQDQIDAAVTDTQGREFPAGTKFYLTKGVDTSTEGTKFGEITVTYPDNSSKVIPVTIVVEDNRTDAEKYPAEPVAQPVEVPYGGTFTPEDGIANLNELPVGIVVADITDPAIDTTVPGDYTAKVKVTYPDGSTQLVDVPVKVLNAAESFTAEPVAQPVEVPYGGTFDPADGIANKGELPAGTTYEDVTETPIDTTKPGAYVGEVKVTYPDGSSEVVNVPVTVKTAAETFNPLPAPVEVEQGGTVNPDDTIANLGELPEATTVTLPEDFNTNEVGTHVVDVTVTYPDGSSETVQVEITVTEADDTSTDADKYEPTGQQAVVELGGTVNSNDTIANLADLPAGTTVTIAPEVDTSVEGVTDVTATVTYPDWSTDTVKASVKVVDNRPDNVKYDPVAEVITVEKDAQPTQEQLNNAVSDKGGKAFPEDTSIALKAPVDTSTVGEITGTVVVTYLDGTADEVAVTINVVDTSDAATYEPQVIPVEVGYGKTLPALDTAITNKGELPAGTTYEDVTETPIDTTKPGAYVGKVKVTYPDGSSEVVNVPVTVKTAAETFNPLPAPVEVEQGGTVNPDDTIANLGELPEATTVTLPEDFNTNEVGTHVVDVTVTYPDGSSETVQVEITVTEPEDTTTDADKYEPVPAPVEVEVGGKVNPDDTIANLDELPDGTTVTVPDVDTTKPGKVVVDVTVTYPDGSEDVVEVEVTIVDPDEGNTDADKYEPKPVNPVEVEVGGTVDAEDVIENLEELPDGTVVDIPDVDTSKPGTHEITVTVTYPDGSTDSFDTVINVVKATDSGKGAKPGSSDKLPITGISSTTAGLGVAALLAIVLGGGALVLSRRRYDN